jgi:hypothetical protein
VISRVLVILLAFIAAGFQAGQGGYIQAVGLFGLGTGLIILKFAATRPTLRPLAWASFAVTIIAMAIVFFRR